MAVTPLVNPLTSTGIVRSIDVPSPSRPDPLTPQHFTPPVLVSSHVWNTPPASPVTPLVNPLTSTGVVRSVELVVPSPTKPQHFAPPVLVIAHVWNTLPDMVATPLVSPLTLPGIP